MSNRNAKVIIPLVVAVWLLFIVVFSLDTPAVIQAVAVVGVFVAIVLAVFYLMAAMGWTTLARHYRRTDAFTGTWQPCATGQMSTVSVHHPQFGRNKMRFIGVLKVGTTADALNLSTALSRVPLLGRFFPDLQIPWGAVSRAHTFEAPGWVAANPQGGAIIQATYDPNYTGTFVELEAGDPTVFLQLPLDILGDARSRLSLAPAPEPSPA